MVSKYRRMNTMKMAEMRKVYPNTFLLRRAVDCRHEARLLRAEVARMQVNRQGAYDRERLAEMCEEKVGSLLYEHEKTKLAF